MMMLMPDENRETLQVLLLLLKEVANHAHVNQVSLIPILVLICLCFRLDVPGGGGLLLAGPSAVEDNLKRVE